MLFPRASVMMDIVGTELSADEITMLSHPLIGGVILFSRNFQSSQQLIALTSAIRNSVDKPLLIAVDHEGGRVQRFRTDGFTHLPAMGKLSQQNLTKEQVTELGWLMAAECIAHGIDLSFAPVLDLDLGSDVVGDRSFADNAEQVIELASYWCDGMQQAGMACVGKHFPGHGSTKEDTHIAAPRDLRSFEQVMANDGLVFKQLIKAGTLDAIMPAHINFTHVDDSPVGYSKHWLQGVLRQQLDFKGIIFSDDLSMVAAGEDLTYSEKAQLALNAGCDMVLICNNQAAVAELLADTEISLAQANSTSKSLCTHTSLSLAKLQSSERWQQASALALQYHN